MKAHQRIIRERFADSTPRTTVPLSECEVIPITREQAATVILKYEWLGTMNTAYQFGYGLSHGNDLLGAVCFGSGSGTRAALSLCGEQNVPLVICLERGACVHYAHEHAAVGLHQPY